MGSIPHVFLVPLDLVSAENRAELILECLLPVMLLLAREVRLYRFHLRLAYRERAVPGLPREPRIFGKLFVNPTRRVGLEIAHEVREAPHTPERNEQVNVV